MVPASRCVLAVLLLGAVACSSPLRAADGLVWSEDIEGSLRTAAAAGRPVLMEFTASWCVYCKRMEKTTFTNDAVMKRIAAGFVPVRVDADKHKDLVKELGIQGLPAILIVSPDLQIIERISGFQTAEALVTKLDKATSRQPESAAQPAVTADARTARTTQASTPPRRGELDIEAITQDEAPQVQRTRVRPVSQPAAPAEHDFNSFEESLSKQQEAASDKPARDSDNPFYEAAPADESPATTTKQTATLPAFGGQCLVSAVEDRELQPGSSRHRLEYHGKLLYFRTAASKELFEANPDAYWPALDGSCAMTLLNDEERAEGQLKFAAVFRKHIWLFASERNMKDFLLDPAEVAEEVSDLDAE